MHTFRRLSISWRQEVGARPFEAQKAAGHAKPDTTFLYTFIDQEREKQHAAKIYDRVKSQPTLAAMAAAGGVQ